MSIQRNDRSGLSTLVYDISSHMIYLTHDNHAGYRFYLVDGALNPTRSWKWLVTSATFLPLIHQWFNLARLAAILAPWVQSCVRLMINFLLRLHVQNFQYCERQLTGMKLTGEYQLDFSMFYELSVWYLRKQGESYCEVLKGKPGNNYHDDNNVATTEKQNGAKDVAQWWSICFLHMTPWIQLLSPRKYINVLLNRLLPTQLKFPQVLLCRFF